MIEIIPCTRDLSCDIFRVYSGCYRKTKARRCNEIFYKLHYFRSSFRHSFTALIRLIAISTASILLRKITAPLPCVVVFGTTAHAVYALALKRRPAPSSVPPYRVFHSSHYCIFRRSVCPVPPRTFVIRRAGYRWVLFYCIFPVTEMFRRRRARNPFRAFSSSSLSVRGGKLQQQRGWRSLANSQWKVARLLLAYRMSFERKPECERRESQIRYISQGRTPFSGDHFAGLSGGKCPQGGYCKVSSVPGEASDGMTIVLCRCCARLSSLQTTAGHSTAPFIFQCEILGVVPPPEPQQQLFWWWYSSQPPQGSYGGGLFSHPPAKGIF